MGFIQGGLPPFLIFAFEFYHTWDMAGKFERVDLLAYGPIADCPPGVNVVDAEEVLSFAVLQELLGKRRKVQHCSDAIRFLKVKRAGGGWVIDLDHTWIEQVPDLYLHEAPFFGHWASSLDLHPCSMKAAKDRLP